MSRFVRPTRLAAHSMSAVASLFKYKRKLGAHRPAGEALPANTGQQGLCISRAVSKANLRRHSSP